MRVKFETYRDGDWLVAAAIVKFNRKEEKRLAELLKAVGWPFEFDEEIIVLPSGQRRVVRRCDHKPLSEPRCDHPASWVVEGYYDGRFQFRRYFCSKHMREWQDALDEDERRGVLSWAWSYDIRRIASNKTLQKWMKLAMEP